MPATPQRVAGSFFNTLEFDMSGIVFTDAEKIRCFEEICGSFYNRNFGRLSKTDMDLMMFRFYLQKAVDASRDEKSGEIDYRQCSDFKIARELGITPAKVRSLKTRVQLASNVEYKWKEQFLPLIENADYDSRSLMVSLHVPDPRMFLEIQDLIEDRGGYVEKQLNGSLLRVKAPYFLEVLAETEADEGKTREELLRAIQLSFAGSRVQDVKYDPMRLGKSILDLMGSAAEFTSFLGNLQNVLPPAAGLTRVFIGRLTSFFQKKESGMETARSTGTGQKEDN